MGKNMTNIHLVNLQTLPNAAGIQRNFNCKYVITVLNLKNDAKLSSQTSKRCENFHLTFKWDD